MSNREGVVSVDRVESLILSIRGRRVILDSDLARLYGVTTARLNEQVKRNPDRFPPDFMFPLSRQEFTALISQNATSKGRGGRRKLPNVFTEHGAIMAATVLNSPRAVQMSVFVVRAFVKMHSMLLAQKDLAGKLAVLEKKLTKRLDLHERVISDIIQQIMALLNPSPKPAPPRKQIGFQVKERRARYGR